MAPRQLAQSRPLRFVIRMITSSKFGVSLWVVIPRVRRRTKIKTRRRRSAGGLRHNAVNRNGSVQVVSDSLRQIEGRQQAGAILRNVLKEWTAQRKRRRAPRRVEESLQIAGSSAGRAVKHHNRPGRQGPAANHYTSSLPSASRLQHSCRRYSAAAPCRPQIPENCLGHPRSQLSMATLRRVRTSLRNDKPSELTTTKQARLDFVSLPPTD
jgi:hypothetical protein